MTKIHGVGVNDSQTPVYWRIGGVQNKCKFYQVWTNMLERCYSAKFKEKYPTYEESTVCEEWLVFSRFKAWMQGQDWEGNQLDKDLLVRGNKHYSPETCVFVSRSVNMFLVRPTNGSDLPRGVTRRVRKHQIKYIAQCYDTEGSNKYIGIYNTCEEAVAAWYEVKQRLAEKLAKEQKDLRVAKALIEYFQMP